MTTSIEHVHFIEIQRQWQNGRSVAVVCLLGEQVRGPQCLCVGHGPQVHGPQCLCVSKFMAHNALREQVRGPQCLG